MSKWIEHIKDYAKRNNMTYKDALKDPKCSEEYRSKNPKTIKVKKGGKLDLPVEELVTLEKKKPIRQLKKKGMGMPLDRDMVMKLVGEGMKC